MKAFVDNAIIANVNRSFRNQRQLLSVLNRPIAFFVFQRYKSNRDEA